MIAFHFAWVDAGQTSFSSAFAREDEQVLSFELAQEEGDFASLRLEVRNPRVGLGAGAFLVTQRPSFWLEFGARIGWRLLPLARRYVSKRMPPEVQAAWREAEKRGQGDAWLKDRWRRKFDR